MTPPAPQSEQATVCTCTSCTSEIPVKVARDIQRLWDRLDAERVRIIIDWCGAQPSFLCASCFIIGYGIANEAVMRNVALAA